MNNERLSGLKEKYKNRNLLEELSWGIYADHSGYTRKQNGEFLNWLCLTAYETIKSFEGSKEYYPWRTAFFNGVELARLKGV